MLDAYIIEKIKREQERDDSQRIPLRIDRPNAPDRPRPSWHDDEDDEPRDRGIIIIDL